MEGIARKTGTKSLWMLYNFQRFGFEEFPVLKKFEMRTSGLTEPGSFGICGFLIAE